jgi:hypothetical protein
MIYGDLVTWWKEYKARSAELERQMDIGIHEREDWLPERSEE